MRYFLCLSYDGADFCGWQVQPHAPSVQAVLEAALSRLLGGPVPVTGCGRTDTGVHAFHYVAHFEFPASLPYGASDFIYKLNAILPRSVAVLELQEVADDTHARFSARRREYTYFIHRKKDPFVRNYSWLCGYPQLDFDAMNRACQYLLGTHEFSCFEKTGGDNKTSICTVYEAFWQPYTPSHIAIFDGAGDTHSQTCVHPRPHKREGPADEVGGRGREATVWECVSPAPEYWYFRIAADRFLRNMVRAIVGTLIEIGRGKQQPEWVLELLQGGTRSDAGESVPGHALFLSKVLY